MQIILLIVIAGVWAMFLIPSFVHSRREAPIVSTQEFAQNTQRLNVVRAMAASPELSRRRHVLVARRRALMVLSVTAVLTLAAAIYAASLLLLGLNIVVDIMLGVYVALLLQVKQRAYLSPPVQLYAPDIVEDTAEQATVRVLAG